MTLSPQAAVAALSEVYRWKQYEMARLMRVAGYVSGTFGIPRVPEKCSPDIKEIAKLSVKNVLSVVRDTFAQSLLVSGYRSPGSGDNDAAWSIWNTNFMDERQHAIHRGAITYGHSYAVVAPVVKQSITSYGTAPANGGNVKIIPRSPLSCLAVYEDERTDITPVLAVDSWIQHAPNGTPLGFVTLFDDENMYVFNTQLANPGNLTHLFSIEGLVPRVSTSDLVEVIPHNAGCVPVIRFRNLTDSDGNSHGEIESLITMQEAINATNFDRLLVSRFGAFPQKVISGWTELSKYPDARERVTIGPDKVWSFADEVRTSSFNVADLRPYNDLLQEQMEQIAMSAQLSPAAITGKVVNVSADAVAAVEAGQQRKLNAMRLSFGQSHKQMLALAAQLEGNALNSNPNSEIIWVESEARTFAAVVDGIVKLSSVGIPITVLADMIPGITALQVKEIKDAIGSQQAADRLSQILAQPVELDRNVQKAVKAETAVQQVEQGQNPSAQQSG